MLEQDKDRLGRKEIHRVLDALEEERFRRFRHQLAGILTEVIEFFASALVAREKLGSEDHVFEPHGLVKFLRFQVCRDDDLLVVALLERFELLLFRRVAGLAELKRLLLVPFIVRIEPRLLSVQRACRDCQATQFVRVAVDLMFELLQFAQVVLFPDLLNEWLKRRRDVVVLALHVRQRLLYLLVSHLTLF